MHDLQKHWNFKQVAHQGINDTLPRFPLPRTVVLEANENDNNDHRESINKVMGKQKKVHHTESKPNLHCRWLSRLHAKLCQTIDLKYISET